MEDLEARIKVLEEQCRKLTDIEAIKQLRYRYWQCVHNGIWDGVGDCFAEHGVADYGGGIKIEGRKAITDFFSQTVGAITSLAVLHGHNPQIEITSDMTARGIWQLDNIRIESSSNKASRQGNAYEEEYVKENGEWKIKSSKVAYLFIHSVEMQDSK